jgi:hypothetical protein
MPIDPTGEPGRPAAVGQAYRRVRKGFAWAELAHLGLLVWSVVVTQVSGYDAPLWSGEPRVAAIAGALYSLLAIILLGALWGIVRAAWAGVYWRREVARRALPGG